MITVKAMRELLTRLPDDATLQAYEGEGIGLIVKHSSGASGFIETGVFDEDTDDTLAHDLEEFAQR